MSYKLPVVSGEEMVKYLARYGFIPRRQTSSHVVMQKGWYAERMAGLFRTSASGAEERHPKRHPQTGRD